MTSEVSVHEAKTHLPKLLRRVMAGEGIVISRAGVPVARLVPVQPSANKRVAASARGKIWMAPDFDDPLPDDLLRMFK